MEGPWEAVEKHEGTGRTIYMRTASFTHTGNNEGEMDVDIEVRNREGKVLASTFISLEWEYFAKVDPFFTNEGCTLVVTATNCPREEISIPDEPTTKQ